VGGLGRMLEMRKDDCAAYVFSTRGCPTFSASTRDLRLQHDIDGTEDKNYTVTGMILVMCRKYPKHEHYTCSYVFNASRSLLVIFFKWSRTEVLIL